MIQYITYGIIKTYKGLFTKKHIGNTQILVIPGDRTFTVLNLVGRMESGKEASQLILRTGLEHLEKFLDFYKRDENFITIEELPCKVKEKGGNNYTVIIPKKGKYIKSNLDITFEPEYSSGSIQIYFIDGKFTLVKEERLSGTMDLKMIAHTNRSRILGSLRDFASKFMR